MELDKRWAMELETIPSKLQPQIEKVKRLHNLFQEEGIQLQFPSSEIYDEFGQSLSRVVDTSVGKFLPGALKACFEELKNWHEYWDSLEEAGDKLSEINFIIGAFVDQLDDEGSFEEAAAVITSEDEFKSWYQNACELAGFDGIQDYEDSQEGDLGGLLGGLADFLSMSDDFDFDPEELIRDIADTLKENQLIEHQLSDSQIEEIGRDVDDSLFLDKEGNRLCLNALYFFCPSRVRVIELSDFVAGAAENSVDKIAELFKDEISISLVDSSEHGDWGEYDESGDEKLSIRGLIDDETFDVQISLADASDPLAVVNGVLSGVSSINKEVKNQLVITRTVDSVWEESGAALLARLPKPCKEEIESLLASD